MTATEDLIDSINSRLRQLNEEINTLTAARIALDGHDPRTIKRGEGNTTRKARPQDEPAPRAAVESEGERVLEASKHFPPPTRPRSRGPTRTRHQKRGAGEAVPGASLEQLLSENGAMSTAALEERADGNRDQVLATLRELEAAGRIRRTGQRRATRWHLITDEERIQKRAAELAARTKTAARSVRSPRI